MIPPKEKSVPIIGTLFLYHSDCLRIRSLLKETGCHHDHEQKIGELADLEKSSGLIDEIFLKSKIIWTSIIMRPMVSKTTPDHLQVVGLTDQNIETWDLVGKTRENGGSIIKTNPHTPDR